MSLRDIVAALVLLVSCTVDAGCSTVPHVNGRWTGVLRSVPVRDSEGHTYDAAAIEIEKGPRLPYPDAPEAAAQSTALLVRRDHTIRDPTKFPVGNRVELTGCMIATTPLANRTGVWRETDGRPDSTSLVIMSGNWTKVD